MTRRAGFCPGGSRQAVFPADRAAHQYIDVRDGLKSTLIAFAHKINERGNITVVKDFDDSLPTIPAHPAELNQVWTNLIDNAIYAMPDGGTLTLRTFRKTVGCWSRSAIPEPAFRPRCSRRSSSRSSLPNRWAKALGSALISPTA